MSSADDLNFGHDEEALPSGERPISYGDIHRIAGFQRASLRGIIGDFRAGRPVEGISVKERTGALEAIVFDDVWHNNIQQRRANERKFGMHGLAEVNGMQGHIATLLWEEDNLSPLPELSNLAVKPISPKMFAEWRKQYQQGDPRDKSQIIQNISNAQAYTMLYEMLRWEEERAKGGIKPIDGIYSQYADAVAEYKPFACPKGIDHPAFRKILKGLLFGTPFEWRVIEQFPRLAKSVQMDWNEQTFTKLMDAFKIFAGKMAAIHGTILMFQGEVILKPEGLDLSDMVDCKRNGDELKLSVAPQLMELLAFHVSHFGITETLHSLDDGPITSCTAYYSDMFDGTLEWNRGIAKGIMVP